MLVPHQHTSSSSSENNFSQLLLVPHPPASYQGCYYMRLQSVVCIKAFNLTSVMTPVCIYITSCKTCPVRAVFF